MNSQPAGNTGMKSQPAENSGMKSQPAGNSGSMTDTLKGYMNVAMSKGQVAYEKVKIFGHKAHGQYSQSKLQAHEAASHSAKQQSNTQASYPDAVAGAQAAPQAAMGNQDAFSDLHEFSTQATVDNAAYQAQKAQQAAANAASKSAQSTI